MSGFLNISGGDRYVVSPRVEPGTQYAAYGTASPWNVATEQVGTIRVEGCDPGAIVSVTFAESYTGPVVVLLTPASENAVKAGLYAVGGQMDFTVWATYQMPDPFMFHYYVLGVAA